MQRWNFFSEKYDYPRPQAETWEPVLESKSLQLQVQFTFCATSTWWKKNARMLDYQPEYSLIGLSVRKSSQMNKIKGEHRIEN